MATFRGDCALCLGDAGEDRVCVACARALPRMRHACPGCALPMAIPETCARCLRRPPSFDAAIAAFAYRFPVDRLVQRFKFAGDLAVGRWLGEQLALSVRDLERPDVLVAPTLARARLRERGFNQAIELARVVARSLALQVDIGAIERLRETSPQPGLGRRERHANLRGVFRATRAFSSAHVAIVDDVMTTGATAEAMARALRKAGARRVSVWVVARTPEPGR